MTNFMHDTPTTTCTCMHKVGVMATVPFSERKLDREHSSSMTSNPECKLLSIAAELRNNIYRFTVVSDHVITITRRHTVSRLHLSGKTYVALHLEPTLAATCSQVQSESLPIFYGENIFDVDQIVRWPAALTRLDSAFGDRNTMFHHMRLTACRLVGLKDGTQLGHWNPRYDLYQSAVGRLHVQASVLPDGG